MPTIHVRTSQSLTFSWYTMTEFKCTSYNVVVYALLIIKIALYTLPGLLSWLLLHCANSITQYNSKEYINAVGQALQGGLYLFPWSYFNVVQVSWGPFH